MNRQFKFILAWLLLVCTAAQAQFLPNLEEVTLPEKGLQVETEFDVNLMLSLGAGLKLNKEAPSKIKFMWLDQNGNALTDTKPIQVAVEQLEVKQSLKLPSGHDNLTLKADSTLYYCDVAGKSVCFIKSYRYLQPIKVLHEDVKDNYLKFEALLNEP